MDETTETTRLRQAVDACRQLAAYTDGGPTTPTTVLLYLAVQQMAELNSNLEKITMQLHFLRGVE